jgi:hypothetical protein
MNKFYLLVFAFMLHVSVFAQTQIAYQGFEGSDTWPFTANPTRYNCFPEDTWGDTTRLFDITSAFKGNKFWGLNDLDNSTCGGGNFYHFLTFPSKNVASYASVFIRFKYYTSSFDATDLIGYMVQYNNSGSWGVIRELDKNTNKWDSVTINVPTGTTSVQFRIVAQQNGGTDFAAVDDIELVGATSDIFAPYVLGVKEMSASQIRIRFSEAVTAASAITTANYTGLGSISSITQSSSGDTVLLNLATALTQGVFYNLTIQNVQDAAGNAVTPHIARIIYNSTTADIRLSEIMYNPPDTAPLEFVELYNAGNAVAQLGGYKFVDGFKFEFPTLTLDPGKYMVVAADSQAFRNFFNIPALQWSSGALGNAGELITLENSVNMTIDSVQYNNKLPWDTLADGNGYSLVVCYPASADNSLPSTWSRAADFKGKWAGIDSVWANPGTGCFPVGIKTAMKDLIKVYPNPAAKGITLQVPFAQLYSIEWYDVLGKLVQKQIGLSGTQQVEINSFKNGNYWIIVKTEKGEIYKHQLSIQH